MRREFEKEEISSITIQQYQSPSNIDIALFPGPAQLCSMERRERAWYLRCRHVPDIQTDTQTNILTTTCTDIIHLHIRPLPQPPSPSHSLTSVGFSCPPLSSSLPPLVCSEPRQSYVPYAPQDEGADQLDSLGESYEYVPDALGDLCGMYAFHNRRSCPQADRCILGSHTVRVLPFEGQPLLLLQ